jgi:hypothetical protein
MIDIDKIRIRSIENIFFIPIMLDVIKYNNKKRGCSNF